MPGVIEGNPPQLYVTLLEEAGEPTNPTPVELAEKVMPPPDKSLEPVPGSLSPEMKDPTVETLIGDSPQSPPTEPPLTEETEFTEIEKTAEELPEPVTEADPAADSVGATIALTVKVTYALEDGHTFIYDPKTKTGTHVDGEGHETHYFDVRLVTVSQHTCPPGDSMETCVAWMAAIAIIEGEVWIGGYTKEEVLEDGSTRTSHIGIIGKPVADPAVDAQQAVETAMEHMEHLVQAFEVSEEVRAEIRKAVEVVSVEKMIWSNGCVGWYVPGQMCTMAIVEGYKVVLNLYGNEYEFHNGVLDPAKQVAILAINDLLKGVGSCEYCEIQSMVLWLPALSDIRIDSVPLLSTKIDDPDPALFEVILSLGERKWRFVVDYWKMEIRSREEIPPPSYLLEEHRQALLEQIDSELSWLTSRIAELRALIAQAIADYRERMRELFNWYAPDRRALTTLLAELRSLLEEGGFSDETRAAVEGFLGETDAFLAEVRKMVGTYIFNLRFYFLLPTMNALNSSIKYFEEAMAALLAYREKVVNAQTEEELQVLEAEFPRFAKPPQVPVPLNYQPVTIVEPEPLIDWPALHAKFQEAIAHAKALIEQVQLEKMQRAAVPVAFLGTDTYYPHDSNLMDAAHVRRFILAANGLLGQKGVLKISRDLNDNDSIASIEVLSWDTKIPEQFDGLNYYVRFQLGYTVTLTEDQLGVAYHPGPPSVQRLFDDHYNQTVYLNLGDLILIDLFEGGYTPEQYSGQWQIQSPIAKGVMTDEQEKMLENFLKEITAIKAAEKALGDALGINIDDVKLVRNYPKLVNQSEKGSTIAEIWHIGMDVNLWEELHEAVLLSPSGAFTADVTVFRNGEIKVEFSEHTLKLIEEIKGKFKAVRAATEDLANQLQVPMEAIRLIGIKKTEFSGCLSLPQPYERCAAVLQSGYKIYLGYQDQNGIIGPLQEEVRELEAGAVEHKLATFIYHATIGGTEVRFNAQESAAHQIELAIADLKSKVPEANDINLWHAEAELHVWGNSCERDGGEICIALYSPVRGYIIKLHVGEKEYVYHTDLHDYVKLMTEIAFPLPPETIDPWGIITNLEVHITGHFSSQDSPDFNPNLDLNDDKLVDSRDVSRIHAIASANLDVFERIYAKIITEVKSHVGASNGEPWADGAPDYVAELDMNRDGRIDVKDVELTEQLFSAIRKIIQSKMNFIPRDQMDPDMVKQIEAMLGKVFELVGMEIVKTEDGEIIHRIHLRAVKAGEAYLHLTREVEGVVLRDDGTASGVAQEYGVTLNVDPHLQYIAEPAPIDLKAHDGVENIDPIAVGQEVVLTLPIVNKIGPGWEFVPFEDEAGRFSLELALAHQVKLQDVKVESIRETVSTASPCAVGENCVSVVQYEIFYYVNGKRYRADGIKRAGGTDGLRYDVTNMEEMPPEYGLPPPLEEAEEPQNAEKAIETTDPVPAIEVAKEESAPSDLSLIEFKSVKGDSLIRELATEQSNPNENQMTENRLIYDQVVKKEEAVQTKDPLREPLGWRRAAPPFSRKDEQLKPESVIAQHLIFAWKTGQLRRKEEQNSEMKSEVKKAARASGRTSGASVVVSQFVPTN